MYARYFAASIAAVVASVAPTSAQQAQRVDYEISFPGAAQHEGQVVATFRGVPRGTVLEARMARSSPGRYSPTGFAKNVYDVRAEDGRGRPLRITQPNPHAWDVSGHDGTVRIRYTVWGDLTNGTYLGIDHSHAHMNIPATFMFAPKMSAAPVRLRMQLRQGWRVATQLIPTGDPAVWTAPNMQYFMDSPTEAGPVMWSTWRHIINGKPSTIRLAVHHLGTQAQVDSLALLTRKVTAEAFGIFGDAPGFDFGTFTFIADYLPWARGDGMEHRNSTIVTSRNSLATHADRMAKLGTISHEFFHAWNIERLRPRSLEPFDFERENVSGELWLGEGFTNYYDPLMVRRAGLTTDDEFLQEMGGAVLSVMRSPARRHGSAVTMSRKAVFFDGAAWSDPTNTANMFLSYYTWGSTIGLALDLMLRDRYSTTLDEYMRILWRNYGRHQSPALAPVLPYTMSDLKAELGRLTRDTAFAGNFFRRYVEGSEVPDYAPLFARAGFLMTADSVVTPYLGASLDNDTSRVFVNWTSANGSMYGAGVANGDLIYSVDGIPTPTMDSLTAVLRRRRPGETVTLDVEQKAVRRRIPMRLVGMPSWRIVTYESAGRQLTNEMRRFRQSWLGSKAPREQ